MGGGTVLIDDFRNLSLERKSAFGKLFVLPVYSNDLSGFIEKCGAKKIAENKYSILLKETEQVNLLGNDVLFNSIDREYGILYGVLRRAKSEDMRFVRKFVSEMDIEPIDTSSSSLYYFLKGQKNYEGYLLREYRAGASLLQSYFKDHTQEELHRLILKRLERDWKDGLKPYFATLKSKTVNETIQIEGEGFITMERLPTTMKLVDSLVAMKVADHRKALDSVRKVRIFRKEELKIPIYLHSNLVIELNKRFGELEFAKLKSASDRLINYLNESAGVYGISRNKPFVTFNLVYSRLAKDETREITTALSVDISPENIIISPNTFPNHNDLVHLYYGIDRYFDFSN